MLKKYVIVTPARNEAQFIQLTINSVIAQDVLPIKWVIVSDASTDGTDEIVEQYKTQYPWIELVRVEERVDRNFANKVFAFNTGYAIVKDLDYEAIVCLDADISFDPEYFSFLLAKLEDDMTLGLVGTPFVESSGSGYDYRFASTEHVSGACQVFRRECFAAIGGYVPVKGGCIDHIAVISSRMKGWKTRTYLEKFCHHHRVMGTAQQGELSARLKNGAKDYAIGNHPVWEFFRCLFQSTRRPYVIGGAAIFVGYVLAWLKQSKRPVSPELVEFYRREQMQRLNRIFVRIFSLGFAQQSSATLPKQ